MSGKAILLSNLTNHSVQNSKFTALRVVAFGKRNQILPQFYRNTPAVPYQRHRKLERFTGTKLQRTLSLIKLFSA